MSTDDIRRLSERHSYTGRQAGRQAEDRQTNIDKHAESSLLTGA